MQTALRQLVEATFKKHNIAHYGLQSKAYKRKSLIPEAAILEGQTLVYPDCYDIDGNCDMMTDVTYGPLTDEQRHARTAFNRRVSFTRDQNETEQMQRCMDELNLEFIQRQWPVKCMRVYGKTWMWGIAIVDLDQEVNAAAQYRETVYQREFQAVACGLLADQGTPAFGLGAPELEFTVTTHLAVKAWGYEKPTQEQVDIVITGLNLIYGCKHAANELENGTWLLVQLK